MVLPEPLFITVVSITVAVSGKRAWENMVLPEPLFITVVSNMVAYNV
jgi:hypothetical protein